MLAYHHGLSWSLKERECMCLCVYVEKEMAYKVNEKKKIIFKGFRDKARAGYLKWEGDALDDVPVVRTEGYLSSQDVIGAQQERVRAHLWKQPVFALTVILVLLLLIALYFPTTHR